MVVDKDLFGNGNKEYSPESCCIVPLAINVMLANCKKHNNPDYMTAANFPLGVRYNEEANMYYGEITPVGHDEPAKLEEWSRLKKYLKNIELIKRQILQ